MAGLGILGAKEDPARGPPGRAGGYVAARKHGPGFVSARRSSGVCIAQGVPALDAEGSPGSVSPPGTAPPTTIGAEVVQFRPGFRRGRDGRDWPCNSHRWLAGLAAKKEVTQSMNLNAQPGETAKTAS